jgi:pimeloyl-ACP methyl ester carboxylesterase
MLLFLSTFAIAENSQTTTIGIQEAHFVKLGGIDQWITIHGANRGNPVLLIIHGGPGDAQSLLRNFYAIYENDFTIVQWDQRGAAKTYAANPNSPPEPERVELDGIELAQYLCNYLGKKKILLLGHSWGSYLGIGMVQKRPKLFAAFIGTGQVGSFSDNVQAQFDFLMSHARAANDRKTLEKLEAIGTPDPTSAEQYFSWWSIRNPYMPAVDSDWIKNLIQIVKKNPEFTEEYLKSWGAGMESIKYFDVVKAPMKKMIIIENAGHFALVTNSKEFLEALVQNVRPLTVSNS